MNKIRLLIILILSSVLLLSCSTIYERNTYVCIYESTHGSIEVKRLSEDKKETNFLIIAHPEDSYHLDCLRVYAHKNEHNDLVWDKELHTSLYKENQYHFTADKESIITVTAYFIKNN